MNFALMFALALGIDYALFIVHRFRGAFFGSKLTPRDAVAVTMDTAGKAVLFSGATVLISLSAVMLVPSPAFRSMALGIMVSVVFVLLATLTLLPAVLAKLGPRVDRLSLRWVHSGEHRSPAFAAWGERLWRRPLLFGTAALAILVAARAAGARPEDRDAVDQGRAAERHLAAGLRARAVGLRRRARPARSRSSARAVAIDDAAAVVEGRPGHRPGHARRSPVPDGLVLLQAVPNADPSSPPVGATIDRLRAALPAGRPRRRRDGREPRPRAGARGEDAARDRRRARARLPAPARRAAGAA